MQFLLFAIGEHGERHAPVTLTRDAPVGAASDHLANAVLAPVGNPVGCGDRLERVIAQTLPVHCHRSEERREGKRGSVRVDLGGRRLITKKNSKTQSCDIYLSSEY